MPPAAQVRDALERVLSSEMFARSERARDFLRYLVHQDLAGNADRLKGYSIAVDVFGRDGSFDPATDTVVRVQAGRLRDLLDQYYSGEGADDMVRISIPRGSYVPNYAFVEEPEFAAAEPENPALGNSPGDVPPQPAAPVAAEPASAEPQGWTLALAPRLAVAAAGLVVLLLVAGAAFYSNLGSGQQDGDQIAQEYADAMPLFVNADDVTGAAPRAMLPSLFLDVRATGEYAERVVGLLRRGLSAFDTLTFIARPPLDTELQGLRRSDYLLLISSAADDSLQLEIQAILTGKVILSRSLAVRDTAADGLEDEVAALLTSVAPASGVIYASIAEDNAETVLVRCLLFNDRFYRNQNAEAHRAAYNCLLDLMQTGTTSPLVYSELAGLHIQAISASYDVPAEKSEAKALEFALQGVQYGPNSPYAHRAMGYVLSRTSEGEEALRWTRKAYELNTFDLGMAASLGYGLVMDGIYAEGTPILQRAVTATSAHPTWWDYGLALGQLMLGNPKAAANAATALAASGRPHYMAVRLVIAHRLGNAAEVGALVDQLRQDQPEFVADPRAVFVRGGYPEDMTESLLQALHEAGLTEAS